MSNVPSLCNNPLTTLIPFKKLLCNNLLRSRRTTHTLSISCYNISKLLLCITASYIIKTSKNVGISNLS